LQNDISKKEGPKQKLTPGSAEALLVEVHAEGTHIATLRNCYIAKEKKQGVK
jgi:hypothetical protein